MSMFGILNGLKAASILSRLRRLKADEAGSTLPLWIAGVAGSAFVTLVVVDTGTMAQKQGGIDAAVHGAALAGANQYKGAGTPEELAAVIAETKRYFYANFKQSDISVGEDNTSNITLDVTPTINIEGDSRVLTVDVKAKVKLAGGIFQLASNTGASLASEATATRSRPLDVEVVLALDTTGSMAEKISPTETESKIVALRGAVSNLMDQLYGASDTPPPGIKISIIPFSQSVNVGKLPGMAGMVQTPAGLETFVANDWAGCISERATNSTIRYSDPVTSSNPTPTDAFDVIDTTPTASNPATFWGPYYADRFVMQTGTGSNTRTFLYNWFNGSGYPAPRWATRNDTSTVHVSSGLFTDVIAKNTEVGSYGSPNTGCSVQAMELDSTYTKTQINTFASQLIPSGWTHTNVAMAWANRMISPQAPFNKAANYDTKKVHKYIVLMTDGAITGGDTYLNPSDYRNPDQYNPNYFKDTNAYDAEFAGYTSSYGPNVVSRLNTDHSIRTAIGAMEQRLLMACQAAKFPPTFSAPDGKSLVTVYTLLLGLSASEITHVRPIYSTCSSAGEEPNFSRDNPNSQYYVEITTNDQLKQVFKSIGASISTLRFTK